MNQVLIWIGFDVVANRQALCSEIAEIKDMVDLTEKDITELQESYALKVKSGLGGTSVFVHGRSESYHSVGRYLA